MSDKHPDYAEIDRLERELFPQWFDSSTPDSPVDESEASAERRRTVGRKNPNWKPSKAVLLDHKQASEGVIFFGCSAHNVLASGSSPYLNQMQGVYTNNIHLRRVGE